LGCISATLAFPGRPLTKATTTKLISNEILRRFFLRAHLIHNDREITRDRLNDSHQSLSLSIDEEQHLRDKLLTRGQSGNRFYFFQLNDLALNQSNLKAEDVGIGFSKL